MWKKLIQLLFDLKVYFYLDSGQIVTVRCKSFECSKLSGDGLRNYTMEGRKGIAFSIDIDKVNAIKVKVVLS